MEEFDAKCGEIAELVNHLHAGEYRLIELLGGRPHDELVGLRL
jgi:hypothetical protein